MLASTASAAYNNSRFYLIGMVYIRKFALLSIQNKPYYSDQKTLKSPGAASVPRAGRGRDRGLFKHLQKTRCRLGAELEKGQRASGSRVAPYSYLRASTGSETAALAD